MTGPINDQNLPNGECAGRDLPDRGMMTGVTETYGADKGALNRGFTDRASITGDTKSDR
jgi:hypothetical protein